MANMFADLDISVPLAQGSNTRDKAKSNTRDKAQ